MRGFRPTCPLGRRHKYPGFVQPTGPQRGGSVPTETLAEETGQRLAFSAVFLGISAASRVSRQSSQAPVGAVNATEARPGRWRGSPTRLPNTYAICNIRPGSLQPGC